MKPFKFISVVSLVALSMLPVAHAEIVNCSSRGYVYNTCYVGRDIERVRLLNRESRSACVEGSSWGYTHNSIWVDHGCRANFEVITRHRDDDRDGGHRGGHNHR